ncbi:tetratricopeptide repeat protein [Piscinibacter sp. XHJ-5]|uniref:tetratricopeptide repeat protein n=1 Tax=Piscinibacter sp. XHJ-5 TaxID=3037797 RepID=UPI0024535A1E|nr:tetratricopeptide repeat protein [Piscinibacter sp. XHJ-5]
MQDARGNPVGTASPQALAHAETALWRMASFFDAPLADIDAAIAADPGWMLPHVMRANFLLTLTEPGLLPEAREALDRAETLVAQAPHRERIHLAAARRCAAGDWQGACRDWDALLHAHPRDLHALQWAHLFDFYRGDAAQLRRRPQRVLPAWENDDPLRPYVLGMQAFGLEECGAYAEAEAAGREAVAGRAKVPWATHAVAHVMEMQGRFEDGIDWLRERQADWAEGNGFAGHHWWHAALFQIEGLDLAGALATYDTHLSSANVQLTLQRLDGVALLWRLHLLGADVGARWEDAAVGWDCAPHAVGHSAFNDVHALMVMLGRGRLAEARAWLDAAEHRAQAGGDDNAAMARQVGLPLMRGLLAFERGDFSAAVRDIAPVRGQAHRFGGSHAQRDLITQTLWAAAARAGESALCRALLAERRQHKAHTPLTGHWARQCGSRDSDA